MRVLEDAGNGNGPKVRRPQMPTPDSEQFFTLYVWGTFDGATVRLEVSPGDGAPWFDTGVEATAETAVNVEFKARNVRGVVSGGGGTTSITADLL